MIRIVNLSINRFRSILSLDLSISDSNNIVALCGQNNVGKTNTLRAINLFFHPECFDQQTDIPRIKHATGGQSVFPKITITFFDSELNTYYEISRNMKDYSAVNCGLSGISYELYKKKKTNTQTLITSGIEDFINKIQFVYIESINVVMPELIHSLTEDMIDVQYNKTRFTDSKRGLKESYEKYVDGLQEIMNSFSEDISEVFKGFQENWSVKFLVPKNSDTFRNLISDDVELTIDDEASQGIVEKGAGLQRLAAILLSFEMLTRMRKRKQIIICIDEPDVFLHEGLQKKLKQFFDKKSETMQLFYSTHSKVFINPYSMKNVFLLSAKNYSQYSVRKQKEINVVETFLIDITQEEGYEKICNHLGIERVAYEVLQPQNLIVEGGCDKKYFSELGQFFGLSVPNIETLNGADNATKFLDFYDSYYKDNALTYKPKIKIVFDNDDKGREVYQKIASKTYRNIEVQCLLLQNYLGDSNLSLEHNNTNNEVEDFMYPEVICFLINKLMETKGMHIIDVNKTCRKIKSKSFKSKGILELCEHEKNDVNPENGDDISFVSSGSSTNNLKNGLAGMFSLQANKKLLNILSDCDQRCPFVREYLRELFTFDNPTEGT